MILHQQAILTLWLSIGSTAFLVGIFLHAYELNQLVGKAIDLNLPTMLSPYFRDEVLRETVTIYEQTYSTSRVTADKSTVGT